MKITIVWQVAERDSGSTMLHDPEFVPKTALDELRPERARSAAHAGLWVAGTPEALAAPTVAIVGTRAPSEAGRMLARAIARDLAANGICIVSGLALGIDTAAHEGALEVGAPTIGVLGGGHRQFFPRMNRALAERMIASGGAVMSPYEPDAGVRPYQFLERNGVIVALCDAVLVVEAAERSGALNTASWAAAASVPVLAIPGDVSRPKVAGCLALLRDGAVLARHAGDVLEALGLPTPIAAERSSGQVSNHSPSRKRARYDRDLFAHAQSSTATNSSDPSASQVDGASERRAEKMLALLGDGPRSIDDLAGDGMSAAATIALLSDLELRGLVQVDAAGSFSRVDAWESLSSPA